jgi:3-deoxy-D-manno-octulosonic-acid transferase
LLAAQTHPGEDETILPAHDALRARYPHLLTIIVPRHTSRGVEIAELCATRTSRQRSKGGRIEPDTAVYIADTIGELGLFYRLASFAFVGGTLVPMGGHNPLEAARLHCAVLAGPHTFNSASAYKAVLEAQGSGRVSSSSDIAALASRLFDEPEFARSMGDAAARGALSLGGAVEKTYAAIRTLLGDHASA